MQKKHILNSTKAPFHQNFLFILELWTPPFEFVSKMGWKDVVLEFHSRGPSVPGLCGLMKMELIKANVEKKKGSYCIYYVHPQH